MGWFLNDIDMKNCRALKCLTKKDVFDSYAEQIISDGSENFLLPSCCSVNYSSCLVKSKAIKFGSKHA